MYLGIDLGTSNSAIASYEDGKTLLFKTLEQGTDVLPSAIYMDKRGHKFYGHRAYEHLFRNPDDAVDGFKRQMGTSWVHEFAGSGTVMSAEECSAEILRQLVMQAKNARGEQSITGAAITIPAAFNQMQIEATKRAAEMAGLDRVTLLQEPVAAAMASVADDGNKDGLFLVYDIGGGTFDLALVQSVNGNVSIIAHEGINALGGRDLDRIIINNIVRPWLMDNFALPSDFQKQSKYNKMMRIMRMIVEKTKIELSAKEDAIIYLPDDDLRVTDEDGEDIYVEIPVSRKDYETLIRDKLDETVELSRKVLKDNGYSSEDMDKLILIGGPSKTPSLREVISHELGVRADIKTDPMTAVALGAAIFCEGVNWQDEEQGRKKTRERVHSKGSVQVQYDYQNRTTKDRARIRIRPHDSIVSDGYEIQIDSTEGWTSGKKKLEGEVSLELPLDNSGDNYFRVLVFSNTGSVEEDATTEIIITRTLAGADALKLTHNLAAEIADDNGEKTTLHIFAEKGQDLPCHSEVSGYRSRRELTDADDSMSIKFFQQPNKANSSPGEPNLFIGAVIIKRSELDDDIREGDGLTICWAVDESGVIQVSVKIDQTGEVIGGKFYSPDIGHMSYEGKDGERLVADMLRSANEELKEAEKISDQSPVELRKLKNSLSQQAADAKNTADGEERRAICEKIRDIRQKIAGYRNDPKNIKNSLGVELDECVEKFDSDKRANASDEECERFDELAQQAREELKSSSPNYSDTRRYIEEMHDILRNALMNDPGFIIGAFQYFSQQRHTAMDTIKHDELVQQGETAIENKDFRALQGAFAGLVMNQIGGASIEDVPPGGGSDITR